MRIAILLFFGTTFGFTPLKSLSQETILFKSNETLTIDAIFEQIEAQTSYRFIYPSDMFNEFPDVKVKKGEIKLEELLKNSFSGNPVNFEISAQNSILLSKLPITAQQMEITGTVSDENGVPVPGVNITIEGTSQGTSTDFDGNYTINAETGQVLNFSSVGFADQSVTIGDNSVIDVVLKESASALDEVVVTALGIKAKPRSLSNAVQTVSADDLANTGETNIVNSLSAKAAGVNVTSSSGSVGSSTTIRIRGNTSVNKANSPLFVIDGVPIDNSNYGNGNSGVDESNRAIDINPNDIESIDILKGVAAQTLYGLRAANGVVLISTKKGRTGAPRVTISSTTQFSEISKLPALQREYAQGRPQNGELVYRGPETEESFSWGPKISSLEFDGDESYLFDKNGKLVPKGQGNGIPAKGYDHTSFFVTGLSQEENISVSGGTDKVRYYLSAGNLDETGIVPKEKFSRTSFRSDITASLTDNLDLSASANYIKSGGYRVQRGSNISGVMVGIIRTSPSFDNGNGRTGRNAANDPETYLLPDGTQRSYRHGIYDNPYWSVAMNPSRDDVRRFIGRMSFDYNPFEWANIRGSLSYDEYSDVRKNVLAKYSANNPQGEVNDLNIFNQDINMQMLLLTENKLSESLTLRGTIGYDGFRTSNLNRSVLGTSISIPGLNNVANTASQSTSESQSRRKLDGVLAEAKFDYKNMLFLNTSFRNDWSSTLPTRNNAFQSYGIGSSFVFTELFPNNVLNYGKLRASFGKVGNDAPIYSTLTYYNAAAAGGDFFIGSNQFPLFSTVAYERSSQQGNENIKPETTTEYELGMELNFFDSRLKLDATYYNKRTKDQVIAVDQPSSSGFTSRIINAGLITNRGWELSGSIEIIRSSDFGWDLDANWTTYKNMVVKLAPNVETILLSGLGSINSYAIPGQPYSSIMGTRYLRNDKGERIIGNGGFPLTDAVNGILGDPNPDWTMGIRNSFSYKNFSLSALIDIRSGGDLWCGTCEISDNFGTSKNTAEQREITDYVFEGVNIDTGEPNTIGVAFADPNKSVDQNRWARYGFTGEAEAYIYSTSWVRLRELSLSYSLPRNFLDKTFLSGGRITLSGRNLFLNTKYPGVDPETNLTGDSNGTGLDYMNQPGTKSYSINLTLNF